MKIAIIDYGSGNIESVRNAIATIDSKNEAFITSNIAEIKKADRLILPGVGTFSDCMRGLEQKNLISEIKNQALVEKKPFLGVCVGMQVLADFGCEDGKFTGLGLISGEVKRIDDKNGCLKVPHMGWNNIEIKSDHYILQNIAEGEHFYFANSYCFYAKNDSEVIASVEYGDKITAIIARENIIGAQFHPEKSGEIGLRILANFINKSFS